MGRVGSARELASVFGRLVELPGLILQTAQCLGLCRLPDLVAGGVAGAVRTHEPVVVKAILHDRAAGRVELIQILCKPDRAVTAHDESQRVVILRAEQRREGSRRRRRAVAL